MRARARACTRMGSAAPCAHWSIGHPKQPLADGTLLLRDRSMVGRTCTRCARATTRLHCVLVALAFLAVSLITATAPTAALPAHADAGRADELVPRPRAALVYLISAKPRHCRLLAQSLRHLQANFNGLPTRQYPVVVFHDGLDGATETFVRDAARTAGVADLRLERAEHFIVPRNVDRGRMLRHIKEGPPVLMRSEGYRTMIRWWSGPVLRESALAAFEYAWRFDTDSFLLRPLAYDPLRDMARRGAKYGYRAVCPEAPQVGKGLSEVVDRWATRELGFAPDARPRTLADPQTISSTAPNGSGRVVDRWRLAGGGVYYTNFEILELGFFRARAYSSLFEACDAEAGFHHRRWGDALVRTHGVDLLVPPNETVHYLDIDYVHSESEGAPFYLGAGLPGCWGQRRWLDLAKGWPQHRGHQVGAEGPYRCVGAGPERQYQGCRCVLVFVPVVCQHVRVL